MLHMLEKDGTPTPDFDNVLSDTVSAFWFEQDKSTHPTQFIVVVVQENDGRKSFWGLIDVPNTPREDIYIEVRRRVYAAYRMTGQENIHGFGIMDLPTVINRTELPKPQAY